MISDCELSKNLEHNLLRFKEESAKITPAFVRITTMEHIYLSSILDKYDGLFITSIKIKIDDSFIEFSLDGYGMTYMHIDEKYIALRDADEQGYVEVFSSNFTPIKYGKIGGISFKFIKNERSKSCNVKIEFKDLEMLYVQLRENQLQQYYKDFIEKNIISYALDKTYVALFNQFKYNMYEIDNTNQININISKKYYSTKDRIHSLMFAFDNHEFDNIERITILSSIEGNEEDAPSELHVPKVFCKKISLRMYCMSFSLNLNNPDEKIKIDLKIDFFTKTKNIIHCYMNYKNVLYITHNSCMISRYSFY